MHNDSGTTLAVESRQEVMNEVEVMWYYRKEAKDRNCPVGFSELKDLSWPRASHGGMAAAAAGNDTSHYP